MSEFRRYKRTQITEARPWQPGDDMTEISISEVDQRDGSPKAGDMIARNPKNPSDKWLVAAQYFADNFTPTCQLFLQVRLERTMTDLTMTDEAIMDSNLENIWGGDRRALRVSAEHYEWLAKSYFELRAVVQTAGDH